ncbi:hypothetical protein G6F62_014748 [Rhizopus arrhizus]|nr:hypothetical protein G6F62_014748 [Rhizopus arrhizus]
MVVGARFRQRHQGAAEGRGAGHVQLVAAPTRGQFGGKHAAGALHVVAVDGERADGVAGGDGAIDAGAAQRARAEARRGGKEW